MYHEPDKGETVIKSRQPTLTNFNNGHNSSQITQIHMTWCHMCIENILKFPNF